MNLPTIDWWLILDHFSHLLVAYLFALPIGWEREADSRGVGLRTFPLVAMASCGYILIGASVFSGPQPYARMLYGLMTGIGFIGGGAILKDRGNVSGTATAAALWTTGAIGAAVAWDRYEIALVLAVMTVITLRAFPPLKRMASQDKNRENQSEHQGNAE